MPEHFQCLPQASALLFHVSEESDIAVFNPRPSPSAFEQIKSDVVFAISGQLLHNYLLPRDCPRVTWYVGPDTTLNDKKMFMYDATAAHIVNVEAAWRERINNTTLYVYGFHSKDFRLIDACAGYYISEVAVTPVQTWVVTDPIAEIQSRDAEIRFLPNLIELAEQVKASTLNFSLIRMRNAQGS